MNARRHLIVGFAAPFGAATHGVGLMQCAAMGVIAAGFSLGPDIDCPTSTVTRALPRAAHDGVMKLSELARDSSATKWDGKDFGWTKSQGFDPDHRALTHTAVSGLVIGLVAALVALIPYGEGAVAAFCVYIMRRPTMRGQSTPFLLAAMAAAAGLTVFADPGAWSVGFAAGVGWLSHIIADGCTTWGVPLLWPMRINGKRWWRVRILGSRLRSGAPAELWVALLLAVMFAAIPTML